MLKEQKDNFIIKIFVDLDLIYSGLKIPVVFNKTTHVVINNILKGINFNINLRRSVSR
jgi:hypothetical protein